MPESGHGNPETSPLCLEVYVPYDLDTKISVQGTGKGVNEYLLKKFVTSLFFYARFSP